ncbi:MAG: tRNA (adenosine(37)-N6)-dimethylallyltransferase MiaA [Candidatus Syntrophonatronum acetioxidans]|uniref:tRNA dimethylallyltransferase n=1 Tax=Candidatus Syntrophonatronum acetioxidans TaxID=1795816 RepID=A0A424YI64_9FIRM|nr:MAG: tRNA (adenosine(37)-N6)-dimethylallyltransferase MiaA [Candidatus Syntrophonatronum acetioxidans]
MKWPLLCIVGPTAVGKTRVSIKAAKRLEGEIISGDSMQIYRYMDIGTAKPSLEEREGVPHHLIDTIEPHEPFSVADFQKEVFKLVPEIATRNRLPIMVGGTGLYLKAIIDQYDFGESKANWELRRRLRDQARKWGSEHLYQQLKEVDPVSAEKIHPHDQKRIIRALEVYYTTGKPISSQKKKPVEDRIPLKTLLIGLMMNRQRLYARIEERVDNMIEEGLEEEVRSLLKQGYKPDLISMQGLGYRHMIKYIKGQYTKEEMVESLKRDTRRFAKRQLTLFRRDQRIKWINWEDYSQEEEIIEKICILAGKSNLTSKFI